MPKQIPDQGGTHYLPTGIPELEIWGDPFVLPTDGLGTWVFKNIVADSVTVRGGPSSPYTSTAPAGGGDLTIIRTSQRPIIDPTHPTFGAVGDGVANDTTAYQAAMTAAVATRGKLQHPSGSAFVLGQITILNANDLEVLGGGSEILWTGASAGFLLSGTIKNLTIARHHMVGSGTLGDAQIFVGCGSGQFLTDVKVLDNDMENPMIGITYNADLSGDIQGGLIQGNRIDNVVGSAAGQGYGIHHSNGAGMGAASTGTTGTTLTDTGKAWATNAWIGGTVVSGGSTLLITGNTGTVLTGAGGWVGGTPAPGLSYVVTGGSQMRIIGNTISRAHRISIYQARGSGVAIIGNTSKYHKIGEAVQGVGAINIARSCHVVVSGNNLIGGADCGIAASTDSAGLIGYDIGIDNNTISDSVNTTGNDLVIGSTAPDVDGFMEQVSVTKNRIYRSVASTQAMLRINAGKRVLINGNQLYRLNHQSGASAVGHIQIAGNLETAGTALYTDEVVISDNLLYGTKAGGAATVNAFDFPSAAATSGIGVDISDNHINVPDNAFLFRATQTNPNIRVANNPTTGLDLSLAQESLFGPVRAQAATQILWLPSGYIAETVSRKESNLASTGNLASGTVRSQAIFLPAKLITNVGFWSGATGLTRGSNADSHVWFGIADKNRKIVAISADDTASAWAGNAAHLLALGSTFTPPAPDLYYLFLMVNMGTGGAPVMPFTWAMPGLSTIFLLTPVVCGTNDTLQTTPLAVNATLAAFAAGSQQIYGYVT